MASKKSDKPRKSEGREIREHLRLRAPVIYKIVREDGDEELSRPIPSLWWSGLAAGLTISLSVVSEGALHRYLPDAPWRPLVENFGYCVGFLIVVMGRLQLFTENTVTAVLPVMDDQKMGTLLKMLRLWLIVFAANFAGTTIFAVGAVHLGLFPQPHLEAMYELAHHLADKTTLEMLLHSVPAGFLIAAMVWTIPSAESATFVVIIVITYVIAVADLAHVVAGSAEIGLLVVSGAMSPLDAAWGFLIPAFVGNVIGGTALFALLAYGQVKEEL